MLRHCTAFLVLAGAAVASGCVTSRLWESNGPATAVVAGPVAVPAEVAVAADGPALVVRIGATDVADAVALGPSRWEPADGFAAGLDRVLAAAGERTLTVFAFVDDEGKVTDRRALLTVATTNGERVPPAPLQVSSAPAEAGAALACAVTWESRRASARGASAFDNAWRIAVTPGAVVADTAILAGALVAYTIAIPVVFVYGVVTGDPTALEAVGAFLATAAR